MTRATTLSPAARIFAIELAEAIGELPGGIFIVGALTDNSGGTLRISDPTGVFTVKLNRSNAALCKQAESLEAPCFVAVYASVRAKTYAGKTFYEVTAESLSETTRDARDAWICDAAEGAGVRIAGRSDAAALLQAITKALDAVKPAAAKTAIADEQIFAVIEELSEKKGAPLTAVLDALKKLGMTEQEAKARLNKLAEDGDLYSPTKETVKVL